jgi:NAD(P)-dependent dehydrogenase (short-subunit alcohol dehydrogenase family)
MRLESKVAIITGGARGQGAAEARLFAREGASVVIGDILTAEGRAVEEEIAEQGGRAVFVKLDVTMEDDWRAAVETAVQRYGKLDILVNNAAILRTEGILDTTEQIWDRVMGVNATGVFLGTKHVVPEMRKGGGGSIVNISSVSGLTASEVASAYHASKGAVRIFTKSSAIELAPDNIRVNSVHPGGVETPMIHEAYSAERLAAGMHKTPMGRHATPDEIAYPVLYLASDEASYVTGAEVVVDGGYNAQ